METQDTMELRDLPVDTRNYTIIDNITGKPIDQSTYSLTIDPEVIGKLNKLKLVNEEKIRQATLKGLFAKEMLDRLQSASTLEEKEIIENAVEIGLEVLEK